MTNDLQRQDKQNFADASSANKTVPPYTIVALIPAGFHSSSTIAVHRRQLTNLASQFADRSTASPSTGLQRRLRCRSHWPPWYNYLLFIPLRPSLSPCPCHCAVIFSEISSLLADRSFPIDIENRVLSSVPLCLLIYLPMLW